MTEQEKIEKITKANEDIKTLEELLGRFDLQKANSTVTRIMKNADYAEAIAASRIANNVPVGKLPFGSLEFPEKIRVLKMLLTAVKTALTELLIRPTKNQK